MVQVFVHKESGPYLTGPYDVVVAPIICSQFLPGMEAACDASRALFITDTFLLVPIAYWFVLLIRSVCEYIEDSTKKMVVNVRFKRNFIVSPRGNISPFSIWSSIPNDSKDEWIRSTNSMSKSLGHMVPSYCRPLFQVPLI